MKSSLPEEIARQGIGAWLSGDEATALRFAKGALFYLSVFAQLTRPGVDTTQRFISIAAMVVTSATFWLLFVQTLHLSASRAAFARSRGTLQGLLAIVLITLGVWILSDG